MLFRRWTNSALVLGLLLAVGCTQPILAPDPDPEFYKRNHLPSLLENRPDASNEPMVPSVPDPANVLNPERPPRYISLAEAVALALENGNVGVQNADIPGLPVDDLGGFTGVGLTAIDGIRVLALDPAIAASSIEQGLSRFDALWTTGMQWKQLDDPTNGLSSFQNGNGALFNSTLAKPLPTGGVAGISFLTDYLNLANPPVGAFSVLNPAYTTRLQFGFDQPLLRGNGVWINQMLDVFPSSQLYPGVNNRGFTRTGEGIVIARLRFDQHRAEFERNVSFLLLNVEGAYWNLYRAYGRLYSSVQGLQHTLEALRIVQEKKKAGALERAAELAQVESQYEFFRSERLRAIGEVLERERSFRLLVGLPVEDGYRIVPANKPSLAPYFPSWKASLELAMSMRPELVLARQEVKAKQLSMLRVKNGLLPDLRLQATYELVGLGTRLDGNNQILDANGRLVPDNSLKSLADNEFNNWTIGLSLNVPLGYREEYAKIRQTRLELAKAYHALRDREKKTQSFLAKQYRRVLETYKQIEVQRLRLRQLNESRRIIRLQVEKGGLGVTDRTQGDSLIDAERKVAEGLQAEYDAVVEYNITLAAFEFARGTLLQHDNVVINEGPLPQAAWVRAVDHHRERTDAIVLRTKPVPQTAMDHHEHGMPAVYPTLVKHQPLHSIAATTQLPQIPTTPTPISVATRSAQPTAVQEPRLTGVVELSEPPASIPARATLGQPHRVR